MTAAAPTIALELDALPAPSYARLAALGELGPCRVCGRLALAPNRTEAPAHALCDRPNDEAPPTLVATLAAIDRHRGARR